MCMSVDLPDPDGPVTATNSPFSTSRSAPRRARTMTSPTVYGLTRFRTEMTGGMLFVFFATLAVSGQLSARLVTGDS